MTTFTATLRELYEEDTGRTHRFRYALLVFDVATNAFVVVTSFLPLTSGKPISATSPASPAWATRSTTRRAAGEAGVVTSVIASMRPSRRAAETSASSIGTNATVLPPIPAAGVSETS